MRCSVCSSTHGLIAGAGRLRVAEVVDQLHAGAVLGGQHVEERLLEREPALAPQRVGDADLDLGDVTALPSEVFVWSTHRRLR